MEKRIFDNNAYPLQNETEKIIGTGIEIHKILGAGILEIVYKDAFEYEFKELNIIYKRENEYAIRYKNIVLPHKFYADFVVFDKIILEIKAKREESLKKIMRKQ